METRAEEIQRKVGFTEINKEAKGVEKVKQIIGVMDEEQRKACLEFFSREESEDVALKKNIKSNIEKVKVGFLELTMDDWNGFCGHLNELSKYIRKTWQLIDRRQQIQRQSEVEAKRQKVQELVNGGLEFSQIQIGGTTFDIRDGQVAEEIEIPF